MIRKTVFFIALAAALLVSSGCHHKVQNPLANVDSKQPDKVLFDRAMDSMKHGRYQEARTLLETLINTYQDSEFIARAKLAVGDAWYAEGGSAAWQQAEVEYKDFQTFFPNLPESSEAQLKVANIHYRQMEKPDRDYGQAQRAAEEYKALVQTYPDSPLVPQAKQRLREVQEVLAERQFRIAHFYYLRDNLAASQARLESLITSFPLYSGIDEALYEMGLLYEKEAAAIKRQPGVTDAAKEKTASQFHQKAIEAYSRIITRYPAMDRAEDAKKRLIALNAPVPQPTAEALAESKAEEASRGSSGMTEKMLSNFKKHPSVVRSARVGEPSMEEEKVASAPALIQGLQAQLNNGGVPPAGEGQASQNVGVEAVGGGGGAAPGANQPPPTGAAKESAPPPQAPPQVNEVQRSDSAQSGQTQNGQTQNGQAQKGQSTDKGQESTSKKKGKKGLRKLVPF
ncbi:MAG TPA: outer membrane protein assembly factor BamD [Terriglobales bacterium]|nr:outer membrane protein assembly factor BamD [Terriglobales bacterium]